jgi:hypothetical protein
MAMMAAAVFGGRGGGARWGAIAGLIMSIERSRRSEGRGTTGGQQPSEAHSARRAKQPEVGYDRWAPIVSGGERREGGGGKGRGGLTGSCVERRGGRGKERERGGGVGPS